MSEHSNASFARLLRSGLVLGLAAGASACGGSDEAQPTTEVSNAKRWEVDPATGCPSAFVTGLEPGEISGFDVADQDRGMFLAVPDAKEHPGPRPLLVGFHGSASEVGLSGKELFEVAKLQDFVDAGFIVVGLDSAMNGTIWPFWDDIRDFDDLDRDNHDLAFFDIASSCVAAHHPVDTARRFVMGASAGASMTNVVLQRRSEELAGGIVASGIFDLTSPPDPKPLDDMFVLVTWTGDTDISTPGGNEVAWFEQASFASLFYARDEMAEKVVQANCHADPGQPHGWMPGLNPWYIDRLLERPKGSPRGDGATLPPTPPGFICESSPYRYTSGLAVSCEPGEEDLCHSFCQLVADCAVSNSTVGPVVADQVAALGFSGEDNAECGGCIAQCQERELTATDAEALRCLTEEQGVDCSQGGVEGFQPFADGLDGCCAGRDDSPFCMDVCGVMLTNDLAPTFFPNCTDLVGS